MIAIGFFCFGAGTGSEAIENEKVKMKNEKLKSKKGNTDTNFLNFEFLLFT
jgi:hypothetical protein